MENPSNKIISMVLNGQTIRNVDKTTLATTGLTAQSGSNLNSWTIDTQTINDIVSIGIVNSPNLVGPIRFQLYDSFSGLVEATSASVGQIVSLHGEYIEQIVITTNATTSDGQPPRDLKLKINGCFKEETLRTKAQVEERDTTTTTANVALCYESNILTRENAQFYANEDIVELSKAYLNMKGTTFQSLKPNVTIKFYSDDVIVTKMYAQTEYAQYPSNVQQICVTLYDKNAAQLTYPNGSTVPLLISQLGDPIIQGWFPNVKTIRIQLCNTSDGLPPTRFRFAVVGCYSSVQTYIMGQATQTTQPVTTTQPRKLTFRK